MADDAKGRRSRVGQPWMTPLVGVSPSVGAIPCGRGLLGAEVPAQPYLLPLVAGEGGRPGERPQTRACGARTQSRVVRRLHVRPSGAAGGASPSSPRPSTSIRGRRAGSSGPPARSRCAAKAAVRPSVPWRRPVMSSTGVASSASTPRGRARPTVVSTAATPAWPVWRSGARCPSCPLDCSVRPRSNPSARTCLARFAGSPSDSVRPLTSSRFSGENSDDPLALRAVTDELMFEIRRLSGQDYVDRYAKRHSVVGGADVVKVPPRRRPTAAGILRARCHRSSPTGPRRERRSPPPARLTRR